MTPPDTMLNLIVLGGGAPGRTHRGGGSRGAGGGGVAQPSCLDLGNGGCAARLGGRGRGVGGLAGSVDTDRSRVQGKQCPDVRHIVPSLRPKSDCSVPRELVHSCGFETPETGCQGVCIPGFRHGPLHLAQF